MKFSELIRVDEAQIISSDGLTIYKNPTFSELKALASRGDLRGVASLKDVYVCNSYMITHGGLVNELFKHGIGIGGNYSPSGFIYVNRNDKAPAAEWDENRLIVIDKDGIQVRSRGIIVIDNEDEKGYKVFPLIDNRVIASWNK